MTMTRVREGYIRHHIVVEKALLEEARIALDAINHTEGLRISFQQFLASLVKRGLTALKAERRAMGRVAP